MSAHINDSTIYIGCQCHAPEHIIRVSYFEWEEDEPEIYFELQSHGYLSFWNRLKMGIKFIFGHEKLEWHDVIPNNNDLVDLHRVLTTYLNEYKVWKETNK